VFQVMMTTAAYESKPVGGTVWAVRKKMRRREFDGSGSFLRAVMEGHAWMPGIVGGGPDGPQDRSHWMGQQLIGLDFDNTCFVLGPDGKPVRGEDGRFKKRPLEPGEKGHITCSEAFLRLDKHGIVPFIAYESYSSSEEHVRFRLVIRLAEPCEDPDVMEDAIRRLVVLFPESDQSCKDLARFFYGSNASKRSVDIAGTYGAYEDCDIRRILELPAGDEPRARKQRVVERDRDDDARYPELLRLIQDDTGEEGKVCGRYRKFWDCPVCGHHDCFVYYEDTDSWACFSDSNCSGYAGGRVVQYVMARDGVSYSVARSRLLNGLAGRFAR